MAPCGVPGAAELTPGLVALRTPFITVLVPAQSLYPPTCVLLGTVRCEGEAVVKSAQQSSCCSSSLVPHLPIVSLLGMLVHSFLQWELWASEPGLEGHSLSAAPVGLLRRSLPHSHSSLAGRWCSKHPLDIPQTLMLCVGTAHLALGKVLVQPQLALLGGAAAPAVISTWKSWM